MRDAATRDDRPAAPLPIDSPRAVARSGWWALAIAGAMVPPGWWLIARAHRFHLTPPVVVLCLGWLALVGAGLALVRSVNATLDRVDDDWFAPAGSRDELEREKKGLLRAIKDIEFDRDTGKLSAADATLFIDQYRARAIDVIKAIELGAAQSPREKILAEVRARATVAEKSAKALVDKHAKAGKKAGREPVAISAPALVEPAPQVASPPATTGDSETAVVNAGEAVAHAGEAVAHAGEAVAHAGEAVALDPTPAAVAAPIAAPTVAASGEVAS